VPPERGHGPRALTSASTLLVLLLLASCTGVRKAAPLPDGAAVGPTKGKGVLVHVTWREERLPGTIVSWFPSPRPGEAPVASGATDRDGNASFDLPPGRYFLVAQWRGDGDYARRPAPGDRYAYFGGNPVHAARGEAREIFIGLEEFPPPPGPVGEPQGGTGVAGLVLSGGRPAEGARVFAYLRTETAFRDPGFAASAPTGPDGSFVLELPPGSYYILARRREGGGVAGPMRKGDLFGYYPGNPVVVPPGRYERISVPATLLKLRNQPAYSGGYRAAAFVEGRILGADGKPRAGVYAALYDNPALLNRPVFLSDVTGQDGVYRLPVPVPGTYFLGARSGYGGSPIPGDLYGRYEGNPEHRVVLRDGDRLVGVDIVVNLIR
jgi:hypothetical protein